MRAMRATFQVVLARLKTSRQNGDVVLNLVAKSCPSGMSRTRTSLARRAWCLRIASDLQAHIAVTTAEDGLGSRSTERTDFHGDDTDYRDCHNTRPHASHCCW